MENQPSNQPTQTSQPTTSMPVSPIPLPTQTPVQSNDKKPFFRMYWIFAAIFLILPPIFGLVILLSGDIYRKDKQGQVAPISKKEKITLAIIACVIWVFVVLSQLSK